jgi:hypothetical protein
MRKKMIAAALALAACGTDEPGTGGTMLAEAHCTRTSDSTFSVSATLDMDLPSPGNFFVYAVVVPGEEIGATSDTPDYTKMATYSLDCGRWVNNYGYDSGCTRPQNSPAHETVKLTYARPFNTAALNGGDDLLVNMQIIVVPSPSQFEQMSCER